MLAALRLMRTVQEATETGMAALLLAITIVLAMHIHLRALGSSLVLGEVEPVK